MDTMKCPACGKEIPSDAVRCNHCGQIQGFGNQKLGAGIKAQNTADEVQSVTPSKDNPPVIPLNGTEEPAPPLQPAVQTGSKLSRLNTILTGKTAEEDLDSLRQKGLLPEIGSSIGINTSGNDQYSRSGNAINDTSDMGLPDWLHTTEFNPGDEVERTDANNSQAELAASKVEIPDWVRKLQERVLNREDTPPKDEQSAIQNETTPTSDNSRSSKNRERSASPVREIPEPDTNLVESVIAYIGGLKSPRKIPADDKRRLSRSIWGVIGLTMFSLIATLLWSGSSVTALPQPAEANLVGITTKIDSMSPEAVVLVGIDYDVSLAGEVENAALPVLVHLMRKQVSLVFISTRPTGPALANHLLDLGMNWMPDYPDDKAFVFSYLPGGAAGLLQMAISPRQALAIVTDGTNPWLSSELSQIQNISDFSLVILLTDSSSSGRDWLEQVQPRLGDTPLYAIVSRQAEPILLPYQESGQIQSLIAGISDGANYERIYLFTTNNQQMLRAYQGALLFMAILLVCVIVLSIFPQKTMITPTSRTGRHASR
jgi:hypothetical protein